ncbi:MAG TPA: hypothetical protein ENG69_01800 [Candidatus Korarchaeota archaeon]|nr:hypothetical protein [Candidatus Korarchaeota archaeon]
MQPIPEEFIDYAFRQRRESVRRMLEKGLDHETLLGFTRHSPAIITCGPAGPNGSIKGVGFLHRDEVLPHTLELMREELSRPFDPRRAAEFLLEEILVEDKIDFTKMATLELAKGHTWENVRVNPRATLLFFTPPSTSYEVRVSVEIHEVGPIWEFVNALHDIFHRPKNPRDWSKTPTYLFRVEEIYDNSVRAMGKKIYPLAP